jgi:hypothetical protein
VLFYYTPPFVCFEQHIGRNKIVRLFLQSKGKAFVDRNMPNMCGQLKWAMELKAKMSFSVKRFKELNHPVTLSVFTLPSTLRYNRLGQGILKGDVSLSL